MKLNTLFIYLAVAMALVIFSCTKETEAVGTGTGKVVVEPPKQISPTATYADGKTTFTTVCIRCHNANPTKQGAIGPAIACSSLPLVTSKVTTGTYPTGYKPKRSTKIMPKMPNLANKVDSLHLYLNSSEWGCK
jgi:mono/diheme cytochrome c family protein